MKVTTRALTFAVVALSAGLVLSQNRSTPQPGPNRPAETNLAGVNIFDTAMLLLDMFGSPHQLTPLGVGAGGGGGNAPGTANPGAGGASGGGSGAAGNRGGRTKSLPGANTITGDLLIGDPFGTPTKANQNRGGSGAGADFTDDQGTGASGGGSPRGGRGGAGGGGGVGGGGGAGAAGTGGRVLYTRWTYERPTSRYSFIVDKFNRVIQIEAIGIKDENVVTSRGIGFGASFADILRAYGMPDAYELGGNSIVMRYLVNDHVAFRLNKLDEDDPHKVTGIVVSAGKQ